MSIVATTRLGGGGGDGRLRSSSGGSTNAIERLVKRAVLADYESGSTAAMGIMVSKIITASPNIRRYCRSLVLRLISSGEEISWSRAYVILNSLREFFTDDLEIDRALAIAETRRNNSDNPNVTVIISPSRQNKNNSLFISSPSRAAAAEREAVRRSAGGGTQSSVLSRCLRHWLRYVVQQGKIAEVLARVAKISECRNFSAIHAIYMMRKNVKFCKGIDYLSFNSSRSGHHNLLTVREFQFPPPQAVQSAMTAWKRDHYTNVRVRGGVSFLISALKNFLLYEWRGRVVADNHRFTRLEKYGFTLWRFVHSTSVISKSISVRLRKETVGKWKSLTLTKLALNRQRDLRKEKISQMVIVLSKRLRPAFNNSFIATDRRRKGIILLNNSLHSKSTTQERTAFTALNKYVSNQKLRSARLERLSSAFAMNISSRMKSLKRFSIKRMLLAARVAEWNLERCERRKREWFLSYRKRRLGIKKLERFLNAAIPRMNREMSIAAITAVIAYVRASSQSVRSRASACKLIARVGMKLCGIAYYHMIACLSRSRAATSLTRVIHGRVSKIERGTMLTWRSVSFRKTRAYHAGLLSLVSAIAPVTDPGRRISEAMSIWRKSARAMTDALYLQQELVASVQDVRSAKADVVLLTSQLEESRRITESGQRLAVELGQRLESSEDAMIGQAIDNEETVNSIKSHSAVIISKFRSAAIDAQSVYFKTIFLQSVFANWRSRQSLKRIRFLSKMAVAFNRIKLVNAIQSCSLYHQNRLTATVAMTNAISRPTRRVVRFRVFQRLAHRPTLTNSALYRLANIANHHHCRRSLQRWNRTALSSRFSNKARAVQHLAVTLRRAFGCAALRHWLRKAHVKSSCEFESAVHRLIGKTTERCSLSQSWSAFLAGVHLSHERRDLALTMALQNRKNRLRGGIVKGWRSWSLGQKILKFFSSALVKVLAYSVRRRMRSVMISRFKSDFSVAKRRGIFLLSKSLSLRMAQESFWAVRQFRIALETSPTQLARRLAINRVKASWLLWRQKLKEAVLLVRLAMTFNRYRRRLGFRELVNHCHAVRCWCYAEKHRVLLDVSQRRTIVASNVIERILPLQVSIRQVFLIWRRSAQSNSKVLTRFSLVVKRSLSRSGLAKLATTTAVSRAEASNRDIEAVVKDMSNYTRRVASMAVCERLSRLVLSRMSSVMQKLFVNSVHRLVTMIDRVCRTETAHKEKILSEIKSSEQSLREEISKIQERCNNLGAENDNLRSTLISIDNEKSVLQNRLAIEEAKGDESLRDLRQLQMSLTKDRSELGLQLEATKHDAFRAVQESERLRGEVDRLNEKLQSIHHQNEILNRDMDISKTEISKATRIASQLDEKERDARMAQEANERQASMIHEQEKVIRKLEDILRDQRAEYNREMDVKFRESHDVEKRSEYYKSKCSLQSEQIAALQARLRNAEMIAYTTATQQPRLAAAAAVDRDTSVMLAAAESSLKDLADAVSKSKRSRGTAGQGSAGAGGGGNSRRNSSHAATTYE